MKRFALPLLALAAAMRADFGRAEQNPPPASLSIDLGKGRVEGSRFRPEQTMDWVESVEHSSGYFDATGRGWVAPASLPEGIGRLVVRLHRNRLPSDLAMTLVYEETPGSEIVAKLADGEGRILAPDLFSNILTKGREAQTDTFILPLQRFPAASQVVLRRIRGDIRLYGLVLTPVQCEQPSTACGEQDLAVLMDRRLRADARLSESATQLAHARERAVQWENQTLQTKPDLCDLNQIGCKVLRSKSYPSFTPSRVPLNGQPAFAATPTAGGLIAPAIRLLNLYHEGARITPLAHRSPEVERMLLDDPNLCGIMSVNMSVASREKYAQKFGYPLIELPVALNTLDIVVHESNPIRELTIPQLDAIFGREMRAGATAPVERWGDLGLQGEWADRPIRRYGPTLAGSGTVEVFRRLVLQGGAFRADITDYPIEGGWSMGEIIRNVSRDADGIGYHNSVHTWPGIRTVAVARNTGETAYRPDEDSIYRRKYPLVRFLYLYTPPPERLDPVLRELLNLIFSREGQERAAERGILPLGPTLVQAAREKLKLDLPALAD